MIPHKLKKSLLFNEGRSYLGETGEITLPKLSRKMEEWRGGGSGGPVMVDMGNDAIEFEWKVGGVARQVLGQYGEPRVDGLGLTFVGQYQSDDAGTNMMVEISVRGRHQEIDMGGAKDGDDTEWSVKTVCSYLKIEINGVEEIEIDLLNQVFRVRGVDRDAEWRAFIGF